MNPTGIRIKDLLPQRDRMLLIDEIIAVDDERAVTAATVTDQWPFYDTNDVNPLVLIELVAQTAAVTNGWVRIKQRGKDSEKKGWLVGIKQSRFFVGTISLNQRIITRAENQFVYESYRHISGIARIGDAIVGEVSLQLFQTDTEG